VLTGMGNREWGIVGMGNGEWGGRFPIPTIPHSRLPIPKSGVAVRGAIPVSTSIDPDPTAP